MNKKASSLIYGMLVLLLVVLAVAMILIYTGVIPLSLTEETKDTEMEEPIGSDYCGFTTGQIIGMFENMMGKSLNKDIGYSVINSVDMKACGSNSKLPDQIIGRYMTEYSQGWYVISDDTQVRSGYYYRTVVWGNTPLLSNSSFIKAVISAHGTNVKAWYNYDTITATSHGTKSGYVAFLIWLTS